MKEMAVTETQNICRTKMAADMVKLWRKIL